MFTYQKKVGSSPPAFRRSLCWNHIWNFLFKVVESAHEPVLQRFIDAQGNVRWRVFEAAGEVEIVLQSQQEVQHWIETFWFQKE